MASSAFAAGSLSNVYRWRYIDGAGAQDIKPMPIFSQHQRRTAGVAN